MPREETHKDPSGIFSTIPSFAGLDASALSVITQVAIHRDYAADQVVFLEGEPCSGMHIVEEGWLKSVKISPIGREQVIRFVGPGEAFNEIGVFTGGPNLVTVEALEATKVWIIPRVALLKLMDGHPALSHMIIQNLARRIQHLMTLVEDLSLRTVESRVARLLLEHSTEDVVNRKRWATQAEMAAHLGTVPDVLNRILRGMVEQGLLEIERYQIKILDRKGLEEKTVNFE